MVGPGIFNDLAALVPPLRTDSVYTLCGIVRYNFRCPFIPQYFAPLKSSSLVVTFDASSQRSQIVQIFFEANEPARNANEKLT